MGSDATHNYDSCLDNTVFPLFSPLGAYFFCHLLSGGSLEVHGGLLEEGA